MSLIEFFDDKKEKSQSHEARFPKLDKRLEDLYIEGLVGYGHDQETAQADLVKKVKIAMTEMGIIIADFERHIKLHDKNNRH